MDKKERAKKILKILKQKYPKASCDLPTGTAWELLVSTMLSAQATDKSVLQVTPGLFKKYSTVQAFTELKPSILEKEIRSIGLSKTKSKNVVATAKLILKNFSGQVPAETLALESLPGVGRKTACVVLGNYFKIPAIAVDTHVKRLSFRMGFTKETNTLKIEKDLNSIFPKKDWALSSHLLIRLGREFCLSRAPRCENCPVAKYCMKKGVS